MIIIIFIRSPFFLPLEYDQILDEEHTKLLQTNQYPSEAQFIWNNVGRKICEDDSHRLNLDRF